MTPWVGDGMGTPGPLGPFAVIVEHSPKLGLSVLRESMESNPVVIRYWFRFDPKDPRVRAAGAGLGCGVTAFTRDDAEVLIRRQVFEGEALPPIQEVAEGVDVSTLDQDHVLPNLGLVVDRRVWFPRLLAPDLRRRG
ncbi:MAG: hypothetical protein AAGM22_15780 [Acidobacteriota bacterium]